jgi:hypothetical protein
MAISLSGQSTLEHLFNMLQKYVDVNGFSIVLSM